MVTASTKVDTTVAKREAHEPTSHQPTNGGCGDFKAQLLPEMAQHELLFPNGGRVIVDESGDESAKDGLDAKNISIDVTPRPILAAGKLVDLLIHTDVGHYIDFRPMDGLFLQFTGAAGLQRVPASRSDVFQNEFVNVVEKRLLTRFIKTCISTATDKSHGGPPGDPSNESRSPNADKTFQAVMSQMKLSDKLQNFIWYSVLFRPPDDNLSFPDGCTLVNTFQASLLRFETRTPFLYANFGTAELSQAFCRLCAVHGGTYVLSRGVRSIRRMGGCGKGMEEGGDLKTVSVTTTAGDEITARLVYIGREFDPAVRNAVGEMVWRFVGVVDGSLVRGDGQRVVISLPRGVVGNSRSEVRVRQVDSAVGVCPRGLFIVYAESVEEGACEEDVLCAVRAYVCMGRAGRAGEGDDGVEDGEVGDGESCEMGGRGFEAVRKPRLLWGMTYGRVGGEVGGEVDGGLAARFGDGVEMVCAPEVEIDCDGVLREAERCFRVMYPEGEFFPGRDEARSDVDEEERI